MMAIFGKEPHRAMVLMLGLFLATLSSFAQGDAALREQADALFDKKEFAKAMPMYSQLVSLQPADKTLNYKLGTCIIHSDEDKSKAVGFLEFATKDASTSALAWYYYGMALHLDYRFREAATTYGDFAGRADKKLAEAYPTNNLIEQCRNGGNLLSNIKDVRVLNKVEVPSAEFFRYYDLNDIGGKIVVTPEELLTSFDKKKGLRSLVYLPDDKSGAIYFSSYGKDGRTGLDIYRSYLMPDGRFEEPQKLAGYVNTEQDEDFAYMQPDGKTFYFSSKGHNSMGGYDVFKSKFDPLSNVFGPAVNLDFAVNTPDDDILYITDPTGEQACFASGRASEQGKTHVYRVQTESRPIALTMLVGNYSSAIDPNDREATIIIEDAVSKEVIGEYQTDAKGAYVLSLPRAGKYKFLVKAGPSGRTHIGVVDLPRSTSTTAYKQELLLVEQNAQEKLLIKNYFDEPLTDDLMALAIGEIKRRAQLDVNGKADVVVNTPIVESTAEDLIQSAGFNGRETEEDIMAFAAQEIADLEATAKARSNEAVEAFKVADQRAEAAATLQREAEQHVLKAESTTGNEANEHMKQAAMVRERSRLANQTARASQQLGMQLEQDAATLKQGSLEETAAKNKLKDALNNKNDEQAVELLTTFKQRMDIRQRPGNSLMDVTERLRREATKQKEGSDRAMKTATSMRTEQQELKTRIQRLQAEADATNKTKVKEQLLSEAAGYQQQLGYLEEETEAAFSKADELSRSAEIATTQSEISEKVVENKLSVSDGEALTPQQKDELGSRIATNDQNIESLAIDQRIEMEVLQANRVQFQRDEFDWQLSDVAARERQLASAPTQTNSNRPVESYEGPVRTATSTTTPTTDTSDPTTTTATTDNKDAQSTNTDLAQSPNNTPVDTATASMVPPAENLIAKKAEKDAERFLLNNQLNETRQLREATRNKEEQAQVDVRIEELEAKLKAVDSEEKAPVAANTGSSPEITSFDPNISDGGLIALLDPDYGSGSESAKGPDQDALNVALKERAEQLIQVNRAGLSKGEYTMLEAQPRIARLQEMVQDIDDLPSGLAMNTVIEEETMVASIPKTPIITVDPVIVTSQIPDDRPVTKPITKEKMPERYVSIDRTVNMEEVMELPVEHRMPGEQEAKRARENDIEKASQIRAEMDSLLAELETMPLGKEHDKVLKKAARSRDDLIFHREEMGRRSEFLIEKEKQFVSDSLKALDRKVEAQGYGSEQPVVRMANSYKNDARLQFDKAEKLRGEADRSQDVIARDSLFRHAYAQELMALKSLDRAVTADHYMLNESTQKGANITYDQIEQALFGEKEELLATAVVPVIETSAPTEELPEIEVPEATTPDPITTNAQQTTAQTNEPVEVITAPVENEVASTPVASTPDRSTVTPPRTTTELPPLSANNSPKTAAIEPTVEVMELRRRAEELSEEAVQLERRSIYLADRSIEVGDSVGSVKRRDQEGVQAQSTALLKESNDTRETSLQKASEARALEREAEALMEGQQLAQDLGRYYDIQPNDQKMVMERDENSRYFMSKSKALRQVEEAQVARARAKADRDRSTELIQQAQDIMLGDARSDLPPTQAQISQARDLNDQAVAMEKEAKVLDREADRLESGAKLQDQQADLGLRELQPEVAQRLASIEVNSRRSMEQVALNTSPSNTVANNTVTTPATPVVLPSSSNTEPSGNTTSSAPATTEEVIANTTEQTTPPVEPVANTTPPVTVATTTTATAPSPATVSPSGRALLPPLQADVFNILSAAPANTKAIVMDAPMPSGIVYKVQVGAFRNALPDGTFAQFTPVVGESTGSGFTRYTVGLFNEFMNADQAKEQVRAMGYSDAFVVAYLDGKRITLSQAREGAGALASNTPASPRDNAINNANSRNTGTYSTIGSDRTPVATNTQPSTTTTSEPQTTGNTVVDDPRDHFDRIDPDQSELAERTDRQDTNNMPVDVTAQQVDRAAIPTYVPKREDPVLKYATAKNAAEALNTFDPSKANADYYDENAAPAKQVEVIKGLFYTVQVGVYSKPVKLDQIFNINPLNTELIDGGKIRYTTGMHMDVEAAQSGRVVAINKGVTDAFITAYMNGERITVAAARDLLAKFGTEILAKP